MLYNERVELILQQVQLQAIVKINDLKRFIKCLLLILFAVI